MAPEGNLIDKAIQKFVLGRLQYVNCLAKNPKVDLTEPSEKSVTALAEQLCNIGTIGPEAATAMITAITDSMLADEQKHHCIELIQAKVLLVDKGGCHRRGARRLQART